MPHVLIIEDDPVMLRGLHDNFRRRGYDVTLAEEGRMGLAAALTHLPDLIILDLMLPGLNGYEICRSLRRQGVHATIIMLTAKGEEDDVVRGLDLGADDYVTKPFSVRELLARADAFLRRAASGAKTRYAFGDCVLDLSSHTLTRGGRDMELTSKEFGLLKFLVTHGCRAITRREILNAVWGRQMIVSPRSVDRCITTLRGKIEPDPREPTWIHTVRDIGYRFALPEAESS